MTNEEKVQELAISYTQYDSNEDVNIVDVVGALRDMAEWKDHQFKEYLEKKRARLSIRSDLIGLAAPFHAKLINEIINELFNQK